MFVIVGIVILIVSFVLALVSLIREQKSVSDPEPELEPEPELNFEAEKPNAQIDSEVELQGHQTATIEQTLNPQKEALISKLAQEIESHKAKEETILPQQKFEDLPKQPQVEPLPQDDGFWNKLVSAGEDDAGDKTNRGVFPWEENQPENQQEPQQAQDKKEIGGKIDIAQLVKKQKG